MSETKYKNATYGELSIGIGERPAILVVDFQVGFTDPIYTLGKSTHIHEAVENTAKLLDYVRKIELPVASCRVGWG